jgi:anti-sigma B factor antagonist
MGEDLGPVPWAGQQAVVALPVHMDASNAGQIREELLSVIDGGAPALIADMTATTSCDHAGADAVVRVFQRAVVSGTALRLVVPAGRVSRMLSLSGLDRLVSIYPSLEAATAASAPAEMPAVVAGAWWQQIMGGKRHQAWAIATFVSGSAARARRAGRWSTWLCRSSVVRGSGPGRCAVRG